MTNEIRHIAFIADGNSTWAKKNNIPIMDAYRRGMNTMCETICWSKDMGISNVTFYAFSSENWGRPKAWISSFMNLAMEFFKNDPSIKKILDLKASLKVIGDKTKLSEAFQDILNEYEEKTKDNEGINVQLAISYGARDEIVRAARKMCLEGIEFSEDNFSNNLDTAGVPDPDLIIRTSGKQRLSNFLLWQSSYSEFYFTDVLWPDFSRDELAKAIEEYKKRTKTYGK